MNKILKHLTDCYTEINRMTVYSHNNIPMVPKIELSKELWRCHAKVKAELNDSYVVKKFYAEPNT